MCERLGYVLHQPANGWVVWGVWETYDIFRCFLPGRGLAPHTVRLIGFSEGEDR